MFQIANDRNSLRVLSEIFSPAALRKMIDIGGRPSILRKINKFTSSEAEITVAERLAHIHEGLLHTYRSEYFYKNALLTNELFKKYRLSETVVLNEFRIGKSKADFVLLNGECRIYEIKSDLDSLHKLAKQISDYRKFSDKIYIVTSEKFVERILAEYHASPVGILLFNRENKLIQVKSSESDVSELDHVTIFNTLRKNEYLELVKKHLGVHPDVPNTKIVSTCKALLSAIEVTQFQRIVIETLKQRKPKASRLIKSKCTPKELKYLCYISDLSDTEYYQLYKFLNISY
jgi:hypothetical protein